MADFNDNNYLESPKTKFSIKDIWGDGILWAVPKHKRSVEKKMNRRFGFKEYVWKPLVPKTNIITCRTCGHFHEAQTICSKSR